MVNSRIDLLNRGGLNSYLRPVYSQFRVKEWPSIRRKLERRERSVDNLDELHLIGDLVGVRMIFLYEDEVEAAKALLMPIFEMVKEESHWASDDPAWFGYRTCQWTVGLNSERARWPGWQEHEDKKAEIQLRTVVQHAWAECNHPWVYKAKGTLPEDLQREFAMLACDLERCDRTLRELRDKARSLRERYRRDVVSGQFESVSLNAASLDVFLEDQGRLVSVIDLATAIGYEYDEDLEGRIGLADKFMDYAMECGIDSVADLQRLIESVADWRPQLERVYAFVRTPEFRPAALPLDILIFVLAFQDDQAIRLLRRRDDFKPSIIEAIAEVREG
jgi:putative GTP pyrophosphokinase